MPVQFDASYPELLVELVFPAPIGTVDITEYWLRGQTFIGRARRTDRYEGSASITLEDWDGRFTPGQTAGVYSSGGVSFVRPRVGIRVRATWASVSYGLFRGYVANWKPVWDEEGQNPTCVISCVGPHSILAGWNGDPVAAVGAYERSGARVSRILTAASAAPFGTSIATGSVELAATDLSGNGASQIEEVCDAEGGTFWYDGSGVATFESRDSLATAARSNTSQMTLSDSAVFFRSAEPTSGDDLIRNKIAMQRDGGVTQVASDSASQSLYGVRAHGRTGLPLSSDVDALAAAQFDLFRSKDPDFRLAAATIDPVMAAAAIWPHALGRKIRDRVTVSADVIRSGITVAGNAHIEGIGHTISQNSWATTFALSSAEPWDTLSNVGVWNSGLWDTMRWFF